LTQLLIFLLAGMLAGCGNSHEAQVKERLMATKQMTLWELVDYIGDNQPLRREKIEALFEIRLEKAGSSNEFWTFWDGVGGVLQNDVSVSRIYLGVKNNDDTNIGALTLDIVGSYVRLDELRQKYNLELLELPRGRSLDEETTYGTSTPWGELVFGFAERNRECLSSVGFGPVSE
jgi:hypothetical protein